MSLSFLSIDKSIFVDLIKKDEQRGIEWGLKWFIVIPKSANYFAVMRYRKIVGVYYLNPYLSGFELGVYVSHSKRRNGILRQLIKLLSVKDLYVEISHHNRISLDVFKRLGFETIHENTTSKKLKRTASY